MEAGIIGNCQYSALVDPSGNITWLCWPRFDSSFVFGGLLDSKRGGDFRIGPASKRKGEQTYLVNTNVLRTVFTDESGSFELIDFAPRFEQYDRFFKPNLLVRIVNPLSGNPIIEASCEPTYDYGLTRLQAIGSSNHIHFQGGPVPLRLYTDASITRVSERRPFLLNRPYYFIFTWGRPLEASVSLTGDEYLKRTVDYWRHWVKHCLLPTDYQDKVIRSALVLKLHQFEDTGAIIAATTTSIPEAEGTSRNWDYRYCWLRDAYFTVQALHRLSQWEELEKFEEYLRNIIEISPKDLQPVYGISGEADLQEMELSHLEGYSGHRPVRVGNAAFSQLQYDLYGEMILAISPLYLDARFKRPNQAPSTRLIEMLLEKIDSCLDKADAGIWEFRGIKKLHGFAVLMHWAGASKAMQIAMHRKDPKLLEKAENLFRKSQSVLNDFWNPELGAYAQSLNSVELDASLLMMVNLGFLKKGDPKAFPHVEAIEKKLRLDKTLLLRRYSHLDDFGETNNAFLVCTFWLAEAYAHLEQRERANEVLKHVTSCANSLGLYSEDVQPFTLSRWGNFPQAYSHVGLINAAFALNPPW